MGVAAGMIFITFEMTAAAFAGVDFFSPLRMTGATVLGHGALESSYSLGVAGLVGLLVHATLSAVYGAAFGVASAVGPLRRNREVLLVAATAFGALLWAVNFYLVIPVAFPWFLAASPMVQFIAHTFFFGTILGLMLSVRLRVDRPAGESTGAGRRYGDLGLPRAS